MKSSISITISGKVQGVWYRASTKAKAEEFGICGYVKNLSNGEVYIEAEGPKEKVDQLLAWCKLGPELAEVDNIAVKAKPIEGYTTFKIHRSSI